MNIVKGVPPNFAAIDAAFGVAGKPGILFCYGDTVYNPSGAAVSIPLLRHEWVHSTRQGEDPAAWWERYITEPEFRLAEEVPAHRAEWEQFVLGGGKPNRQQRRAYLAIIAKRLSSRLYGRMVPLDEAKELITALGEQGAAA